MPLYLHCVNLYTSILLSKEQDLQWFRVKKIVASLEFSVIIAAWSTAVSLLQALEQRHTTEQRAQWKRL